MRTLPIAPLSRGKTLKDRMPIEEDIESIRAGIKAGRFANEAAVSQGIVLRLLNALGWPTFEPERVAPEFALGGRRVDFALCHPPAKPVALIEVKQIGQSGGAERQLFEYAFHNGIPMAILTDGQEWNFFLPAEQGDYGERRVYKLDLSEREVSESAARMRRYLSYPAVVAGEALDNARSDYRDVSRQRQMEAALPRAWLAIVQDEDELLLEIVADKVESLCGFKPGPDMVAAFMKRGLIAGPARETLGKQPSARASAPVESRAWQGPATPLPTPSPPASSAPSTTGSGPRQTGFTLNGQFCSAVNAIDALRQLFEALSAMDPTFDERFASLPTHGRTRRYLARDPAELYPGRSDLASEFSRRLASGWWLSTNHSRQTISRIAELAAGVAGLRFGDELTLELGS